MKRIAKLTLVVLITILLVGVSAFATQQYHTVYSSAFSFSTNITLSAVDGYPNTSVNDDLKFNHNYTTCSDSDARFYVQPQHSGFLGIYYNFGTTWNSPANTGSTIYGGSQNCDNITGPYRYVLTAYQNSGYTINSPTNRFWINYYGYPDPY